VRIFILLFLTVASCIATSQEIIVDGELSAGEWDAALEYDLEYETMPGRNTPASLKTTALVQYDKDNLYIGFRAYGDVSKMRINIRNRDTVFADDYTAVVLDPYGDGRYALLIGSNAKGAQVDWKVLPNGGEDVSWNILFESAGKILDDGYTVEIVIPFSQIQSPATEIQKWKIGFIRKSFEPGIMTIFASYKNLPEVQCYGCQVDEVVELGSPNYAKRNYIYPYLFVKQNGDRPAKELKLQNPDHAMGITGLLDVSKTSTLEYAINPDFSQVESDAPMVLANETFAVSYPEKRTFFLEGSDLLKSDLQSVYTRSISDPIGAIKYIHQGEKNAFFFMQATDANSPYYAPGEYKSYFGSAGKSKVSVGRYRASLPNKSNLGFIFTNRDYHSGGSGALVEIDGQFNLPNSFIVDLNLAKSRTAEGFDNFISSADTFAGRTYAMDGEKFSGSANNLRLRWIVDGAYAGIRSKEVSPTYRSSVGFVTKNNYKERNYWFGKAFRSEGALRKVTFHTSNQKRLNYQGQTIRERRELRAGIETDFNTNFSVEHVTKDSEKFLGIQYAKQTEYEINASYEPSDNFALGFNFEKGDSIAYNLDSPVIGDETNIEVQTKFRITDRLQVSLKHRFSELKNKMSQQEFYAGEINRLTLNYQLNNTISSKLIIESNEFSDNYYLEGLFQWKPDPYTIFYAGATQYYDKPDPFSDNIRMETSQIYFKFQYFMNLAGSK